MSEDKSISLRDRLRRETAEAHARVDALFGSADLATEEGYAAFLVAQAVAWEALRPVLDVESLSRANCLREDIDILELATPEPLAVALPLRLSFGHRYVLEGSRLGSTVLLRELATKSPDMAERASAYLTESAKIEPWKLLFTDIQNDRDGCDSEASIIDDALFVFGLFERAWRATDSAQAKVS